MNSWFELKYTLRLLRKNQGFAAICVFVIAVGIGISIPLVSVSKFFGYGSLPLPDEDRLVTLRQRIENQGNVPNFDPYSYRQILQNSTSYDILSAFRQGPAVFSDGETAESFAGAWIEPELLAYPDDAPLMGRALSAGDNLPGAELVAVIGHELWQRYYAGDRNIIGQISRINGVSTTIVGVMPQDFGFPIAHDLWLPLQLETNPEPGLARDLYIVGLLNETVSLQDAASELEGSLQILGAEYPELYAGSSALIEPYSLIVINDGPIFGHLFMGMMLTVLLLVCFNVANLLSARNTERMNELAVRGALGGTRWRITRQVLLESLVVCLVGAVLGIGLGVLGLAVIGGGLANPSFSVPYWITFTLSLNDFLLLITLTFGVWLFSGLYPAWKISRQDINAVLSSDSASIAGNASSRLTRILVTIEIVVSCFLLIVCLSTVAGYYQSNNLDMGVNADGFVSARVNLSSTSYADDSLKLRFLNELRTEIENSDRFSDVTFSTALAGQFPPRLNFELEDIDPREDAQLPQVGLTWVDENYFELMDIELLQGRFIEFSDTADSLPVVIVDAFFAERHWPNESAIGKQIRVQPSQGGEWLTVVGVINHIIQGQPTAERLYQSTAYRPLAQLTSQDSGPFNATSISLAVQTSVDTTPIAELEQELKIVTANVDRDIPVTNVYVMNEMMYLGIKSNSFFYNIMLWMALATVVLAIVGIYGVVSRSVLARSMEIGIRRALGSTGSNIINIFLKQGSMYLAIGLLLGGIGGVMTMGALLQAVGSDQGMSIIFIYIVPPVSILLCLMVFAASYLPARKLVAVDPAESLHYE